MNNTQLANAIAYNRSEFLDDDFTVDHVVRLVQFWQKHHDLEADGVAGPLTQKSISNSTEKEWCLKQITIKLHSERAANGRWLDWDGPATSQPKKGMQASVLGNPEKRSGSGILNKSWYKHNIVECHVSLGNQLPGVPARWYIKVHRVVEPYLREALTRVQVTCPGYVIHRMGSYNFRHMQNNPEKPLSMHAYGAAVDINPSDNSPQKYKKGLAPKAYTREYMRRWPQGLPSAFVQCFTSCGFSWGSDWDEDGNTDDHTFLDPQHMEWIARDGNTQEV